MSPLTEHVHRETHRTRSQHGPQFCRGALEKGSNPHTCKEYTTVHYGDGRRFHFCDEHPPVEFGS